MDDPIPIVLRYKLNGGQQVNITQFHPDVREFDSFLSKQVDFPT